MSKVTKKQLQEDIKSLESGIAMNWSDMKKIEVRLSRAMTDMATRISNISLQLEGQQRQIHLAAESIGLNKQAIIMLENEREAEPEPQLKKLDQSIFDGLDEKWRFAAVDLSGEAWAYREQPKIDKGDDRWSPSNTPPNSIGTGYDTSNWQNSLIERDIAKELLEVDLSSELTGSDYYYSNMTSALLESGSKLVVCFVSDISELKALSNKRIEVITSLDTSFNDSDGYGWQYAIPINNQGEPLTAKEVGL